MAEFPVDTVPSLFPRWKEFPVTLNVYDVIPSLNRRLRLVGLGFYQTGVQVHNVEYMFWGRRLGRGSKEAKGIMVSGAPKSFCESEAPITFCKSIVMGHTPYTRADLDQFFDDMTGSFSYDLFTRNGNHFADIFCTFLTHKEIPSWINRVVRIKWLRKRVLPVEKLDAILIKDDDDDDCSDW